MIFPVNRKATELTIDELLNLYDEARGVDLNLLEGDRFDAAYATVRELRDEVVRRMQPCGLSHYHQQGLQQFQPYVGGLGVGGQIGIGQGQNR